MAFSLEQVKQMLVSSGKKITSVEKFGKHTVRVNYEHCEKDRKNNKLTKASIIVECKE